MKKLLFLTFILAACAVQNELAKGSKQSMLKDDFFEDNIVNTNEENND